MPEINVQASLPLPPVSVASVMLETLESIKTLHVELRDVGLPDVGYVAIPVTLSIGASPSDRPSVFPLSIRAERHPEAFPVFDGQVGADAVGPSSSTLWIGGSYTVPMQQFGALLDATLLGSVAQHAIHNFLDDLAAKVTKRGTEREISEVRAHRME